MQEGFFRDNRFFRFDPHKAPCAAAKIGKLPIRRRNSRDSRSRVVAGNCYDRHFADPRFPCKRIGQLPDKVPGITTGRIMDGATPAASNKDASNSFVTGFSNPEVEASVYSQTFLPVNR